MQSSQLDAVNCRCCRFQKHGSGVESTKMYDLTGKFLKEAPFASQNHPSLQKYKRRPFSLGWHEIRQLLYDFLPHDAVEFDKQVNLFTKGSLLLHYSL